MSHSKIIRSNEHNNAINYEHHTDIDSGDKIRGCYRDSKKQIVQLVSKLLAMKTVRLYPFLLGGTCVFLLFVVFDFKFSSPDCDTQEQDISFITIEENIETEGVEGDDNIFFIETHTTNFHKLDSHQACSIESAGKRIR